MILLYIMRERGGGYTYTRMALLQIMGERGVVRAIPGLALTPLLSFMTWSNIILV
jgi:hypothetical protein